MVVASALERGGGLPAVAELGELVRLEAEEVGVLARVTRVVALLHDGRRDRGGHVAQEVGRLRAHQLVDGQRELLGQRRRVVLAWLELGLGLGLGLRLRLGLGLGLLLGLGLGLWLGLGLGSLEVAVFLTPESSMSA